MRVCSGGEIRLNSEYSKEECIAKNKVWSVDGKLLIENIKDRRF